MGRTSTDSQSETAAANRIGLDYRAVPQRRVDCPIVDFHTHLYAGDHLRPFVDAADSYGISRFLSMTPLDELDAVRGFFGDRVDFIAIPKWKDMGLSEAFRARWIEHLGAFRERGVRLCKFWMAPRMRKEHGLTMEHDFVRPVLETALELGYEFMIHVADPSVWWERADKYRDDARIGSKRDQYGQLEWFCAHVAPRKVVAAHMGGSVEDLPFLQGLLDRHANLYIDTSATKWIVREVARQPEEVHDFVVRNAKRILFGSDLVARKQYTTFDHYASRYWAHLRMWESDYRGESPIEDPDGADPPRLAGVALPPETLEQIYHGTAATFGITTGRSGA